MTKYLQIVFPLIALVIGFFLGRYTVPPETQAVEMRALLQDSLSDGNDLSGRTLSENDKVALMRWLGRHELFRMANRLKSTEPMDFDLSSLQETIDFELVDCVSDCFELNRVIKRLDLSPNAETVAADAIELLSCENAGEFRKKAKSLGFCNQLYVHFDDPSSEEYAKFSNFLSNIFSKQNRNKVPKTQKETADD